MIKVNQSVRIVREYRHSTKWSVRIVHDELPKNEILSLNFLGSALVRSLKQSEVHVGASENIVEQDGFGDSIKDLPRAACLMVRNAPFICTTFAGCTEAFIVAAFTAFLPKYIQTQFNLTSAEAGLYTGNEFVQNRPITF